MAVTELPARASSRRAADSRTTPLALAVLAGVCLASLVVVVVLGTKLTFFNDDWYFLLQRPGLESHGGLDVLLAPHNSNVVFLTALSYKVLVALFGLGSQVPFRVVIGLAVACVGVLVYLLVSERAGPVVGLACTAVVVLLGPAWEDLLFFGAAIDMVGALATGLGAIWMLRSDTPRRNAVACALLVCSVGFSNVGVPFAVGAAVAVALRRRPSQLWIPGVPAALFGLWWAFYGSTAPSHLTRANVDHLPRYVLDSVASGLASATGLNRGTNPYTRGHVLIAGVAIVLVIALLRGWRPRAAVLVPASIALTFWVLTGASFIPGREPLASRYQLIDATLLILIAAELYRPVHVRRVQAAELYRPVRVGRVQAAVVAALAVAVVYSNVSSGLSNGYDFMREQSGFVKADLGALELGRRLAPDNLWLIQPIAQNPYLSGITAGRFFTETGAHGQPPSFSAGQLATAPAAQRRAADSVLASAERLSPERTKARPAGGTGCARLQTDARGLSAERALAPGTWRLTNVGGAGLATGVRRFGAPGSPVYVGLIASGWTDRLSVPSDAVARPWQLSIKGPAEKAAAILEVCPV